MAEFQTIPIDGGVVTSRDESLLGKGELSVGQNIEYRPNDPGVYPMDICGYLGQESDTDYYVRASAPLIFSAGASWRLCYLTDAANTTGRYLLGFMRDSQIGGLTTDFEVASLPAFSYTQSGYVKDLDYVRIGERYFILNGASRNYDVGQPGYAGTFTGSVTDKANAESVLHGMLANVGAPTANTSGAGNIKLSAGKSIKYWIEERWKAGSTVIKRSAATSDNVLTVSGALTSKAIVISKPATVNSDATHWALYGTATEGDFPTGRELGEATIATASITDPRTGRDPDAYTTGDAYEVVSITLAGATVNIAKYGQPPVASTGDVFEDCLVTNDTANPSHVRWSFYDAPHAFPTVNVIKMETKEYDKIVFLRRLGQLLIIGMRYSMWRINSLPQVDDANFQPGRMKEQIEANHGAMSHRASCIFSFGKGPRLAYVSRYGIHVTDGYQAEDITDDFDWYNEVDPAVLDRAILLNNPEKYRLEFYYKSKSQVIAPGLSGYDYARTRCLHIYYHPSHAKVGRGGGFKAKVTGPHPVRPKFDDLIPSENSSEGGVVDIFPARFPARETSSNAEIPVVKTQVYLCGRTDDSPAMTAYYRYDVTTNPANSTPSDYGIRVFEYSEASTKAVLNTGEIYFDGIGGEFALNRTGVHHGAFNSGDDLTVTMSQRKSSGVQEDISRNLKTKCEKRALDFVLPGCRAESIVLGTSYTYPTPSATWTQPPINYFVVEVKGQGGKG